MRSVIQVYHITSGKTVPQWLAESKKKSLKKNDEYRRRLELIQDFGFKSASQRLKITPDRNYIFASGYHPFSVSWDACPQPASSVTPFG
jgi:ribosome biogenesis protein ENP2